MQTQKEKLTHIIKTNGQIVCYSVRERNNVLDALHNLGVSAFGSTKIDEMYISVSFENRNYWFCSSIYRPSENNILGKDFLKLHK